MVSLFGAALAVGMLAGCGSEVDENKTPDQIKAEVAKLDAAAIQKQIDAYKKAIEEKAAELAAKTDELKEIPLKDMLSDKAKGIQGEIAEITKSLDKLKDNMAAYAEGLKAKAGK